MLKLLKFQVKILFFVVFSFVFLFSAAAGADVIYISANGDVVNYLTEDSSGNFTESSDVLPKITNQVPDDDGGYYSYPYYDSVFAFKHNNKNRVLITRRLTSNDIHVMIYDPEDFSAPLASNDFKIPHGHSGGVYEFGDNIIIGKSNAVYEMNPETCEFAGEPYFISDYIGDEVDILVHDGLI